MKYDIMRKSCKKYFLDKEEVYKMARGTKPQSNATAMDDVIFQMLQMEQVEGLPSKYDDDKIENVLPTNDLDESDNGCRNEKPMESSFCEENSKWNRYTPKILRVSKHSALAALKRKATRDVWVEVARMKIQNLELEMNVIEEESKVRKIKLELEIEELKHRIGKCFVISPPAVNKYPKEF